VSVDVFVETAQNDTRVLAVTRTSGRLRGGDVVRIRRTSPVTMKPDDGIAPSRGIVTGGRFRRRGDAPTSLVSERALV